MPDAINFLKAMAAAAIVAAVIGLLSGLVRKRRPALASAGLLLGVALGFVAGCLLLGAHPHFPPREDQDRLLLILVPAVVLVEVSAGILGRWVWLLRGAVAASAGGILLHGSIYLAELAGPGSREWPPEQSVLILAALAVALLAVWIVLTIPVQRSHDRTVPLVVALACGGTAVTVMLSGYASGGQLGFALAAAIAGGVAVTLFAGEPDLAGLMGLAIVGLFALLVIGRFFGELRTDHAVLLFLAPLGCTLSLLKPTERWHPVVRGLACVVLAALPVMLVVASAQQRFGAAAAPASAAADQEGSVDDYRSYGK